MRLIGLAVVLTLSVLAPLVAEAQAGKVYRIGFLGLPSAADHSELVAAFRHRLRDLGYEEGKNISMEYRWAEGRDDRLPALAAELVRLKVDVIVASATPPAKAAQGATDRIPIVFTGVADPIGVGLVANLARPGRNITGFTTSNVELSAKRLEFLKAAVPNLTHVAVLVNRTNPQAPLLRKQTERGSSSLGLELQILEVESAENLSRVFKSIFPRVGALLVLPDPWLGSGDRQAQIAALALKHRLPTMERDRSFVAAGGLMSYGPNAADLFRESARHVDKILKGTKPADIPVEQPTKFELFINMKTATALGLTIPQALLQRADQVIQ
jgi:putative tryptophan/tyrosine transport system substrate-binding protein